MISENIITDKVKRTCRNFNSFIFQQFSIFMSDDIRYLQVLVVQRRFCQLQIKFLIMTSLYIYKLKINAKLQETTLFKVRHVIPPWTYPNLRSQNFIFNVSISCHGRFKAAHVCKCLHMS